MTINFALGVHISSMEGQVNLDSTTEQAIAIWRAGVDAVVGESAVCQALQKSSDPPANAVLAVGKAASSMLLGALPFLASDFRGLLVTKHGHVDAELQHEHRLHIIESGHPVPDANSLAAGCAALRFITSCNTNCQLLVLVSGGASALMETPVFGVTLKQLQHLSQCLLSDGYSIDQINHIRINLSLIKGGRLLRRFQGKAIQVLGLSDIPDDQAELIGSGIGAVSRPDGPSFTIPPWIQKLMSTTQEDSGREEARELPFQFNSRLVGSNALARSAAANTAQVMGHTVVESGDFLNGDIGVLLPTLVKRIDRGGPGVYLWGGEPTVTLPEHPGNGGRSQSLALALTLALAGRHVVRGVVAGTDGTDGPTEAAGGIVGPAVDCEAGRNSLKVANAGPWLGRHNRLFVTGPTGTNVMDLAVLIRKEVE